MKNLNKTIDINKKFVLIIILLNIMAISLYYSYALFQTTVISNNKIVLQTGTINLSVSTGETNNTFTLNAGATKTVTVNLTSTNTFEIAYKMYYTMTGTTTLDITSYTEFTNDIVAGTFTTSKTITLIFENTGSNNVTITLGGYGGLVGGQLQLSSGQHEIVATYTPPPATDALKAKLGTDGLIAINTDGGLYDGTGNIREYRYSGVDSRWSNAENTVKNYITFNNEMWRIVGIFKGDTDDGADKWNIKIVRDYPIGSYNGVADSIQVPSTYASTGAGTKTLASGTYSISASGSYPAFTAQGVYWNNGGTNSGYAYPSKSGILLWLNESSNANSWYYKNYDSTTGINTAYKDYIATTSFYTRAGNTDTTVADEYNRERTTGKIYNSEPTYEGKIGMLYASDYAYASASTIWNGTSTTMHHYYDTGGLSSNKLNNWMLKPNDSSVYYWFISPSSASSYHALRWDYSGCVYSLSVVYGDHGLRPVLNLKSDTLLASGSGTYSDPYIIERPSVSLPECPGEGCIYAYSTYNFRIGNTPDSATYSMEPSHPTAIKITDSNYQNVISQSGYNVFLAYNLNTNNVIEHAYVCGINNGSPFCIEGATSSNPNLTEIQTANFNALTAAFDSCDGSIDSTIQCSGDVAVSTNNTIPFSYVHGSGSSCHVFASGTFSCYVND